MPAKHYTRYFQDPALRAAIDAELALADAVEQMDSWIIYAIHDPTQADPKDYPDGSPFYVGQTKQFGRRVRQHLRKGGSAVSACDKIAQRAIYQIMKARMAPGFRVLDRAPSALEALVLETNWSKRLVNAGYSLTNQWAEQKSGGPPIDRTTIPAKRLWAMTAEDAIGSGVQIVFETTDTRETLDLSTFSPAMPLIQIRSLVKGRLRELHASVRVCIEVLPRP